jgi:hypothetical protein
MSARGNGRNGYSVTSDARYHTVLQGLREGGKDIQSVTIDIRGAENEM